MYTGHTLGAPLDPLDPSTPPLDVPRRPALPVRGQGEPSDLHVRLQLDILVPSLGKLYAPLRLTQPLNLSMDGYMI